MKDKVAVVTGAASGIRKEIARTFVQRSSSPCQALAERARADGYPVEVKVYPGARHSFDSSAPLRFIAERHNVTSPTGRGATTGGDPVAWADAISQVTAFFARELKE